MLNKPIKKTKSQLPSLAIPMRPFFLFLFFSSFTPTLQFFAPYNITYKPLVFSGSISTSVPFTSLTVSNAGLPPYSCPPDWELPPSSSLETAMGWFPRNRLRMSTIPRLCGKQVREWRSINLSRYPDAENPQVIWLGGSSTHLHSLNPLRSCWHFVGSSSTSGSRRQSRGLWRWTIMQSDSWRHCARAFPDEGSRLAIYLLSIWLSSLAVDLNPG